ncbi:MAG: DNA-processing protein DprA [Acidimicrobiia bacterium]|nr:DNA-processing protein DprA [Acidimicrobiia bacterium]
MSKPRMKEIRLRLAFSGLHPDRLRDLCEEHGAEATLRGLQSGRFPTTQRVREAVAIPATTRLEGLAAADIAVVFRGDEAYPAHLAELPDAPDVLFVRGPLDARPAVAVVGTRRCTRYGLEIARAYGRAIAEAGWSVVSGLARGIDGAAHQGTVGAGGRGIAVLGSGVDVMYPREHRELARQLLDCGGAVVSEAPPGTPPEAWRFPPRNRIISGLAGAVIVVEAAVRGGALITAEAALRHGRQVFAVPGDVAREASVGCNLLIRDGAFPVLQAADMVESLELVLGPRRNKAAETVVAKPDGDDATVLRLLASGICEIDDLLAELGRGVPGGLAHLSSMELRGLVRPDGSGRYTTP